MMHRWILYPDRGFENSRVLRPIVPSYEGLREADAAAEGIVRLFYVGNRGGGIPIRSAISRAKLEDICI